MYKSKALSAPNTLLSGLHCAVQFSHCSASQYRALAQCTASAPPTQSHSSAGRYAVMPLNKLLWMHTVGIGDNDDEDGDSDMDDDVGLVV